MEVGECRAIGNVEWVCAGGDECCVFSGLEDETDVAMVSSSVFRGDCCSLLQELAFEVADLNRLGCAIRWEWVELVERENNCWRGHGGHLCLLQKDLVVTWELHVESGRNSTSSSVDGKI